MVSLPISAINSGTQNGATSMNIWGTVSAPYVDDTYIQFERMGQPAFNTVFIPAP